MRHVANIITHPDRIRRLPLSLDFLSHDLPGSDCPEPPDTGPRFGLEETRRNVLDGTLRWNKVLSESQRCVSSVSCSLCDSPCALASSRASLDSLKEPPVTIWERTPPRFARFSTSRRSSARLEVGKRARTMKAFPQHAWMLSLFAVDAPKHGISEIN